MNTPALCRGVVIREVSYGESDKCLTVLTDTLGCIPVFCKGAKSYKSKAFVCAQLFVYSEFELYERADRYWLKECSLIENFYAIRENLAAFALAGYVCEVVADVTRENQKEPEILQLLLNTLFVLSRADKPIPLVKAVFEMRLCALAGFCPDLDAQGEDARCFDLTGGSLCRSGEGQGIVRLMPGVLDALRYAVSAPAQRIYSFTLSEELQNEFSRVAERYLLVQLERSFRTLDFYHQIGNL